MCKTAIKGLYLLHLINIQVAQDTHTHRHMPICVYDPKVINEESRNLFIFYNIEERTEEYFSFYLIKSCSARE